MRKFRFRNSSFISAVSVALVLCLIGLECVLLLSAGALVTRMRESMTITVVLTQDVDSAQCSEMEAFLASPTRFSGYSYISAEQALEDHKQWLGEDPTEFLGYNPLTASYEIHPTEAFSHPDSLAQLVEQLEAKPYVSDVVYTRDLAKKMSHNVSRGSLILLIIALVLLVVSLVLIVNTIRLQIYSKRFLINTMTLVGATPWVTRRPFVLRNMLMGFLAGIAALAVLAGVIYYVRQELGIILFPLTMMNVGFIVVVVMCSGILITLFASLIATGRYIRMDNNSLYEI